MRLGTILLESRIIDEAALERALEIQTLTGGVRPLGQVLVEQDLLDRATLERLLAQQNERSAQRQGLLPVDGNQTAPFVRAALAAGASELVVSEGRPVQARVAGAWRNLTSEPVRGPEVWDFVRAEMGPEVLEQLAERRFVAQGHHRPGICRGRITAFRHCDGVAVVLALTPDRAAPPAELAIPESVLPLLASGKGLVLVAGERDMGRIETLSSLLGAITSDPSRYVLVLDDALDATSPSGGAVVSRRRTGDTPTQMVAALRSAIREDPDVIVAGDIGEAEAFDLALRAAEAGRLVIAWVNGCSVTATIQRVLNFYTSHDVPRVRATLAAQLRCVLVRQLLPNALHTGVVAATELLLVDAAVREVLRGGDLANLGLLLRVEGSQCGHSLDRCLLDLLTQGRVRFEDVFARAEEKAWLLERTQKGQKMAREPR